MSSLSLTLDGEVTSHQALILMGDVFLTAGRDLSEGDYLLWLNSDRGVSLSPSVRIAAEPVWVKRFPRHWRWREMEGELIAETAELHFERNDVRNKLFLCSDAGEQVARLTFTAAKGHHWETAAGEGALVVAQPAFFVALAPWDADFPAGPRLRASALA